MQAKDDYQHIAAHIKKNISAFPQKLQQQISDNLNFFDKADNNQIHQSIRNNYLQTLRRSIQPQLDFFNYQTGFNNNLYPVFGIVAFRDLDLGYCKVPWKLCTWVESGGVRCCCIEQRKIQTQKDMDVLVGKLNNLHGLIIPEYENDNEASQKFILSIIEALSKSKVEGLKIMAFGKSSNVFLSAFLQQSCASDTQKNAQSVSNSKSKMQKLPPIERLRVVHNHQKSLTKGLPIKYQLLTSNQKFIQPLQEKCCGNSQKILSDKISVNIEGHFYKISKDGIEAFPCQVRQEMKEQNLDAWHYFAALWELKEHVLIAYCHQIILNFVNEAKKSKKIIKQPERLIGFYPLVFKDDDSKAHYKMEKN